jgi:hypothetical protein
MQYNPCGFSLMKVCGIMPATEAKHLRFLDLDRKAFHEFLQKRDQRAAKKIKLANQANHSNEVIDRSRAEQLNQTNHSNQTNYSDQASQGQK